MPRCHHPVQERTPGNNVGTRQRGLRSAISRLGFDCARRLAPLRMTKKETCFPLWSLVIGHWAFFVGHLNLDTPREVCFSPPRSHATPSRGHPISRHRTGDTLERWRGELPRTRGSAPRLSVRIVQLANRTRWATSTLRSSLYDPDRAFRLTVLRDRRRIRFSAGLGRRAQHRALHFPLVARGGARCRDARGACHMRWRGRITWAAFVLSFIGTLALLGYTMRPRPGRHHSAGALSGGAAAPFGVPGGGFSAGVSCGDRQCAGTVQPGAIRAKSCVTIICRWRRRTTSSSARCIGREITPSRRSWTCISFRAAARPLAGPIRWPSRMATGRSTEPNPSPAGPLDNVLAG